MASLSAIGLVDTSEWINDLVLVSAFSRVQFDGAPWVLVLATIAVPTIGGAIVGLITTRLIRERRPLGPPDTIFAVQTRKKPPSLKSGIMSTIAALVSLGAGASVGQYGPLVYLGTLIGSLVNRIKFGIGDIQAVAISCGVAAAISTAFNAPITGLIFAHEVILRHYSLRAFASVTVASATGYVIANVIFDRPSLFRVEFAGVEHGYEFLLFAVEGVLAALLAVSFMKLILMSSALASKFPIRSQWLRPAIAGLILGIVALQIPEVLGIGKEALRFATIGGAFEINELAILVIAKTVLTALCIGFGFAGGIFSPALLIGILGGALFGMVWPILLPLDNSGIVPYAICGMMAVTSPVIGAPLTTILVVFELTRNYDLTIAAMVAVVFSNLVSAPLFGRSLFDRQLKNNFVFDLSEGRDKAILRLEYISKYMSQDYITVRADDNIATLKTTLAHHNRSEAAIIDSNGRFQASIDLQDVVELSDDTKLSQVKCPDKLTFDENTSLWDGFELVQNFIGESIPIVDSASAKLLGVITEGGIIAAYMSTVHELRREENETV